MLDQTSQLESKELTRAQLEAQIFNKQMLIDQEVFRLENWESLKHFRSKYDNEYHLSSSIMDQAQITSLKKEVDKLLLNAIRVCLVKEEQEKIF